ncbi:MAG: hypothetical protein MI749_11760 [Desulfovibrionales bacterium]|nr:hypothetical protein [Desulfovibrionales bacterium]
MRVKTVFTVLLFLTFLGLCGAELIEKVQASLNRDVASVRYVQGLEEPKQKQEQKTEPVFDLDKIMEDTDVNG